MIAGEQLADLLGVLRIGLRVLLDRRLLAAPLARDEVLGELLDRMSSVVGRH